MSGRQTTKEPPGLLAWVAAAVTLVAAQLVLGLVGPSSWSFTSPILLFWVVVIAASGCVIASVFSLGIALREDLPELGVMSAFSFAVSALPLVHGITTPGVLYSSNPATMSSVLWAVPIGAVAVLPLAVPRSRFGTWVLRHWERVVTVHIGLVGAVSLILLKYPAALPAPPMRSWSSGLVAVGSLLVCGALSVRHLRLGWIAKTSGPLAVSIGFASLGASSLVWFASGPFTAAFWFAHALDIAGVFAITLIAGRAYRQRRPLRSVLAPIIAQTPASALELGLDPIVHQFVAALERKDQITRDHVVRTAALAIAVGAELGLPEATLHDLGVGALLHDVGKLTIPDALINKPGRLDDEEFVIMKSHVTAGAALASTSRVLDCATPTIRGHHERIDGNGYPDGLRGDDIPLLARIVSVCDAYDAMANTRQYRTGMGHDRACAVLQEHAGSQWDEHVVRALINVQGRRPVTTESLSTVGRSIDPTTVADLESAAAHWCGCGDALPEPVSLLSLDDSLVVAAS